MSSNPEYNVGKLTRDDFDQWSALFKGYITFYNSSIPEEQYRKTFERILDEKSDLDALVMRRDVGGKQGLIGLAHFFPEQTPWSEEKIMLLNGERLPIVKIYSFHKHKVCRFGADIGD